MTDAVLEVDGISKRYGAVLALDDVSITARAGELVGLGGHVGAGRTTAIRIGAGVLAADSGRVRWRSAPIDPGTRRRIGYLPALGGLYPELTVLDQLVHRAELHGFDVNEAHQHAELWLDRLHLRALRPRRTKILSTDERRLIALVATLLPGPELLLLDEPFAGASPTGVQTMVELLREQVAADVPVLLSSSDFSDIERFCDRAAILRGGQIVASGTICELVSGGPRLLRVDAPDSAPGWGDGVPGCRTVDTDGSHALLELTDDADDQAVLNAALAAGPVHEFTMVRRTLTELFGGGR
ncbi:MAG TPA: ATP-binding cassette domain-containing protein [Pseudonocardiaceae bacterium]|nr:ATP-binding cassette domain-containing protein [Pseudonocardiaceae bacterium]